MTFMEDLKDRLANRVQLTSDGHRPYLTAVDSPFGQDIDYAILQKLYSADRAKHRPGRRPKNRGQLRRPLYNANE
jgi:hypothetical protein